MNLIKFNQMYQLAFYPNLFPINCYLVEEDDYLVLIDAGMSFCKADIVAAETQIGKPIKKVLLTHAHADHVGALDGLAEHRFDLEVMISERDSRLLAGDTTLLAGEGKLPIKGGIPKNIKTKPTSFIEHGQKIGSLQAIATPGHTPGHMSFFDTRNNNLIVGDAMQTKGGLAVSGHLNWSFPFPALATRDKERAMKSVEKLVALQPTLLATGHGPVIINPVQDMLKALQKSRT